MEIEKSSVTPSKPSSQQCCLRRAKVEKLLKENQRLTNDLHGLSEHILGFGGKPSESQLPSENMIDQFAKLNKDIEGLRKELLHFII